MQSQERGRIAAFLEGAVSAGASSDEVAAIVAATLRDIEDAMTPIVGQRGMVALYQRSLHLCRPLHPWLPVAESDAGFAVELAALTIALARQSSAKAAATGTELVDSLRALLTTLIGESVTERLLRPVWATFLSGPSARSTTS